MNSWPGGSMGEYLVDTENSLSWFWKTILAGALVLVGDFVLGVLFGLWLAGLL